MTPCCDGNQLTPALYRRTGPIYHLPGAFEKASVISKHPTWGRGAGNSLKVGRSRTDEVQFCSHRHQRALLGHFSPGPQYNVPSTIGGAWGNYVASNERMQRMLPQGGAPLNIPAMPYRNAASAGGALGSLAEGSGTAKLSAAQLGGGNAFMMTRGSIADPERRGGTAPVKQSTEYWRSATMLQPQEPNFHKSGPFPDRPQPWIATTAQVTNCAIQDEIKRELRQSWRPEPRMPRRQVPDRMADPVLANVFGSGVARDDYGQTGGMDRQWQTSKVSGYHTSAAPKLGNGKPPSSGPLRYAFIQKGGANSIPRGTSKAEFHGSTLAPSERTRAAASGDLQRWQSGQRVHV